jgi:RNA polymerase sigma-70 factor (ECF subfamily)
MHREDLSDEQAVQLALSGRESGMSVLYDRYSNLVYRKCIALLKNREEAKDVTHDVFIQAFLKLSTLKEGEKFGGWVSAIAYRKCFDVLRLRRSHFEVEIDGPLPEELERDSELEEKLWKEERMQDMEKAFLELPVPERALLLMRYQDGLAVKEIQDILGINESAVKMRLKRARDRLGQLMEKA